MDNIAILSDPASYGSKGQAWNSVFVDYMVSIVTHPVYEGMPDAVKDDGKIQWEAPSNRSGGRYQNTHHVRRNWWRTKAESIGIDVNAGQWISATAKRIHPTGEKPCKRCGRIMRIAYVYPNGHLQARVTRLFGSDFEYDPLEPITDLVQRLVDTFGENVLDILPALLTTGDISVPNHGRSIDEWLAWIEDSYIKSEPSLLSPGAMSNAPDRFDGFHSFNLCCRGKADSGRHDSNMRTYTTDRRVFEYWSEGNWIAADRLMGLIRARFRDEPNADGGEGPCSADHIGPLSLGFSHRPEFRLLSKAANSAKNNRMSLWDVEYLKSAEARGLSIVSWYAKPLWDSRKDYVIDEETALRLSKQLRDNQRNAMHLLVLLMQRGHLTFLATLLELDHANYNVEFENLRIENFNTVFDRLSLTPRRTKYASEQKARRIRIGFEALRIYQAKENRHFSKVEDPRIDLLMNRAFSILSQAPMEILNKDIELSTVLSQGYEGGEDLLRQIADQIPAASIACLSQAQQALKDAMVIVGCQLSEMWSSDRYVRAPFDFDSEE